MLENVYYPKKLSDETCNFNILQPTFVDQILQCTEGFDPVAMSTLCQQY